MAVQHNKQPELSPTGLQAAILSCPKCRGGLNRIENQFTCRHCAQSYPITHNIPQLFWPTEWDGSKTDITEQMKAFYEATPFPNYDDFDNVGVLVEKARKRM